MQRTFEKKFWNIELLRRFQKNAAGNAFVPKFRRHLLGDFLALTEA